MDKINDQPKRVKELIENDVPAARVVRVVSWLLKTGIVKLAND